MQRLEEMERKRHPTGPVIAILYPGDPDPLPREDGRELIVIRVVYVARKD